MHAVFCNGRPADAATLSAALVNYGHFTSMQVRGGAVQGLDLHLRRLADATAVLFETSLDVAQVRRWMDDALRQAGSAEASVRVTVFSSAFDFRDPLAAVAVDVLVAVAPAVRLTAPRSVRTVRFQRELPAVKHVGTFALLHQRRQAMRAGFDDALLLTCEGLASEGTTWNLAVHDGSELVWPQAPALRGTTEALVRAQWQGPQVVRPLPVAELAAMPAAFACNASGVWPLTAIDGRSLPGSATLAEQARQALARAAWQPLAGDDGR